MKKFSALFLIFTMFMFVSCGIDEDDFDDFVDTESGSQESNSDSNTDTNSGDSSNQDSTREDNNSDTGSNTNPDPDQADSGASNSDPNDNQGGNQGGSTGDPDPGTGENDTETPEQESETPDQDTETPDSDTGSGDNGNETSEDENDTYDYDNCTEIILDTKLEYDSQTDFGDFMGNISCEVYYTYYTPRTGTNSKKKDSLNIEFYSLEDLNGTYNLRGKDYSSKSGLFLVVYEDGGAKKYIQRKGTVKVTYKESLLSTSMTAELTGVALEEVTIDNSTHKTTVVPDGACLKIKDTTVSY